MLFGSSACIRRDWIGADGTFGLTNSNPVQSSYRMRLNNIGPREHVNAAFQVRVKANNKCVVSATRTKCGFSRASSATCPFLAFRSFRPSHSNGSAGPLPRRSVGRSVAITGRATCSGGDPTPPPPLGRQISRPVRRSSARRGVCARV